jgi:hypothetical protein
MIPKMLFAAVFGLLPFLRLIGAALWPTILAVWRAPSLLLRPQALSRIFMSHAWSALGNILDEDVKDAKRALITPHAHGIVVDIGAGGSLPLNQDGSSSDE